MYFCYLSSDFVFIDFLFHTLLRDSIWSINDVEENSGGKNDFDTRMAYHLV